MNSYKTKEVCANLIHFEILDNKIHNVEFIGGCPGNLQAVAALVEGMTVDEVAKRLNGIRCGFKSTSCPDQLVKAIENYKENLA